MYLLFLEQAFLVPSALQSPISQYRLISPTDPRIIVTVILLKLGAPQLDDGNQSSEKCLFYPLVEARHPMLKVRIPF
jgi:hypothetical protein